MKISIITSTYNAVKLFSHTAISISTQTYKNFEWIVVDGASSDGTLELIAQYSCLISHSISEPDNGIYDAWNKAIPFATGEWIIFLGAGDTFKDSQTLSNCVERLAQAPKDVTIAYGAVEYVHHPEEKFGLVSNQKWQGIEGQWVIGRPVLPCHQGVFQRIEIFNKGFLFNTRYTIASDTDLLLRELLKAGGFDLDMVVSRMLYGGISDRPETRLLMIAEVILVNINVGIFWHRPLYQMIVLFGSVIKSIKRNIINYFELS